MDRILTSAVVQTGPSELIIIKDEKIIYKKNYGEPARDKVRIASSSKWLVAATLLTLVDDKAISLDDKLAVYLPQFKAESAGITIRQLLSHTSGFPPFTMYLKEPSLTLAQSIDSIANNVNLISEPGTEFNYGGVSFQVAARLAEVVSGKDWETLFNEKIFHRLADIFIGHGLTPL